MTPEHKHYLCDRLVRAVLRGEDMTDNQITSLSDYIMTSVREDEDADLISAVQKFEQRSLSEEEAVSLYKSNKVEDFDVDEYRQSLTTVDSSATLDKKLAEIFG